MAGKARCTVTEKREPIVFAQMNRPRLDLEISWDSGDETAALEMLTDALVSASAKINAARPAAASTPQEGTTTP